MHLPTFPFTRTAREQPVKLCALLFADFVHYWRSDPFDLFAHDLSYPLKGDLLGLLGTA